MNIFARIDRLTEFQFKIVKYFSIRFEGNEVNEFYDFLNRMEDLADYEEDLSNLISWIEEIGEHFGAKRYLFRNESITADVQALPPPAKQMAVHEILVENMRLYCMVLSENVVFLFNGGVKTIEKAQNCPNVGPYIKQANQIVGKIDELLKEKEIVWNENQTDIEFDQNIEFEL